MVAFSAIKVGDVLFNSRRTPNGSATTKVEVKFIDSARRTALIAMDGSRPTCWTESQIKKLRRIIRKTEI